VGLLKRMLAGEESGAGVAGEAILEGHPYYEGARDGSSRGATVNQRLTFRRADGQQQSKTVFVPDWIAKALPTLRGQAVPVRVDPATGKILTVDVPALEALLAGEKAGAQQALEPERPTVREELGLTGQDVKDVGFGIKTLLTLPRDIVRELRGSGKPPQS